MAQSKKTLDDPISPEVMGELDSLIASRVVACEQVVELEQRKVRLLVAIQKLDQQKSKVFERELMDRGQSPTASVYIDEKTHRLVLNQSETSEE